jgi:predicted patatin/cPLA2 family phospholipase
VLLTEIRNEIENEVPMIGHIFSNDNIVKKLIKIEMVKQKINQSFKDLYPNYINNYYSSFQKLQQLTEKNRKFNQLLETISKTEGDLASYLIYPIQMIPRYQLLLKDIIKYTPKDHVDYASLNEALNNISLVASYINEKKRDTENDKIVKELKSRFDDYYKIEKNHRKLQKSGNVTIKTPTSQKLILNGDFEIYLYNDLCIFANYVPKDLVNKENNINTKWFQPINLSFSSCELKGKTINKAR